MSVKRRDKKGRILRNGESQRKDGRYVFTYRDCFGKQKFIYSWKLEPTDKLPTGRKDCIALREKIREVNRDLYDHIVPYGDGLTVLELVNKYISMRTGVRETTRAGYKTVVRALERDPFGQRTIDKVKLSDAKLWLIKLQTEGRSYSSIHTIRGVLRPAFQLAVDDDVIRKNPFEFQICTVLINDSVTRHALDRKQEKKFLEFVKNDDHFSQYYDVMYILFKTGMRISEFTGLTLSDVDLKNRTIDINHQLQYVSGFGLVVQKPKSDAGYRKIPMTNEVYECFKRIIQSRNSPKIEPMIDGIAGFLFINDRNKPVASYTWAKHFHYATEKYNRIYREQMPKVTPHVCRHTYCSNMARKGMNPKTLQYLMGHSDIAVTLNVYAHFKFEDALEEMERLAK